MADMHASVIYWLTAQYRKAPPVLAADASPARMMRKAMRDLGTRWLKRFDKLAPKMADYFASSVQDRNDRALTTEFRKAGLTVRFKPTQAITDAYQAVIGENVALITSIAQKYLTDVEGAVMRSVQTGRDLGALTTALEQTYGVTRRRAALIARTQNQQATAVMQRVRFVEMGITRARWLHSAGGRTPRPEHVAFSAAGGTYDVAKGHDFDNGEGVVWPGTAINCRCVAVPVIPGFEP